MATPQNYNWNCMLLRHRCVITLLRSIFYPTTAWFLHPYIITPKQYKKISVSSWWGLLKINIGQKVTRTDVPMSTLRFFFIQINCWNQNTKGIYRRETCTSTPWSLSWGLLEFGGLEMQLIFFTTLAPQIYKLLAPPDWCSPWSLDGSGKLALGKKDSIWII